MGKSTEIAFLYKKRWGIELLFQKMKQNIQKHCFYGENGKDPLSSTLGNPKSQIKYLR